MQKYLSLPKLGSRLCLLEEAERNLRLEGVIGVDECGTGAWAGPAVVCAAFLPDSVPMDDLQDSKAYGSTPRGKLRRHIVSNNLRAHPDVFFCLRSVRVEEIDRDGLGFSVKRAMEECVRSLLMVLGTHRRAVFDGNWAPHYGEALVKADAKVRSVMAASVIGKSYRDTLMASLPPDVVEKYGFARNAGYAHQAELDLHGPCQFHRRSVEPVAQALSARGVVL